MKLLLATNNPGKVAEIRTILQGRNVEVLGLAELPGHPPEVMEDAGTFAGNAAKKAIAVARWAGIPALADDSGLVVPALGGEPGVHSSRYAGEEGDSEANMALLLEKMADTPEPERLAYFICVMVLAAPDGRTWQAGGRVDGLISFEKRGRGGFGYDPVFFYLPTEKTFAQMSVDEKNRVSHRFRALEKLGEMWEKIEKQISDPRSQISKEEP